MQGFPAVVSEPQQEQTMRVGTMRVVENNVALLTPAALHDGPIITAVSVWLFVIPLALSIHIRCAALIAGSAVTLVLGVFNHWLTYAYRFVRPRPLVQKGVSLIDKTVSPLIAIFMAVATFNKSGYYIAAAVLMSLAALIYVVALKGWVWKPLVSRPWTWHAAIHGFAVASMSLSIIGCDKAGCWVCGTE